MTVEEMTSFMDERLLHEIENLILGYKGEVVSTHRGQRAIALLEDAAEVLNPNTAKRARMTQDARRAMVACSTRIQSVN